MNSIIPRSFHHDTFLHSVGFKHVWLFGKKRFANKHCQGLATHSATGQNMSILQYYCSPEVKIKTQNKSDFADCIMAPYEVILRKQKYLQYSIPKKNLNRIFLVIQLSVVAMTIISSTPPQFQRQLLKHSCHLHAFRSSPS